MSDDDWDILSCSTTVVPQHLDNGFAETANQRFTNSYNGGRNRGGGFRGKTFSNSRGRGRNTSSNSWGAEKRCIGTDRSGGYNNSTRDRNVTIEMGIPSTFVGRVIGRGGSKIAEMQQESDTRIEVTRETDGDETIVKISGDTDADVEKAKELINKTIGNRPSFQQKQPEPATPVVKSEGVTMDWRELLKASDERVAAEWNKLPPIIKNFYQEHPEVTAMTEEEVAQFRLDSNNIVVERTFKNEDSKPIPKPVWTFAQAFHNYPEILEEIRKAGFETPSPIQCQAWPVLLSGEDLIGIAQTGTGKTLAFLLPALIHIDGQTVPKDKRGGPTVLVMAPTRELALQIDKEVKKYQYKGITSVCVYGGGDRQAQIAVVTGGVDIVIATPGRMNDLNEAGHLNVKTVTYVVLDEADRMLDMGFEPQIRKVMYSLRPKRQCIMTSATWPPGVRRLAGSYMTDPIQVYVGSLDLAATHTVTQVIKILEENDKEPQFMDFVRNLGPDDKVIVFCGSKAKADYLSVECAMQGIDCAALHGNVDQSSREQAVADVSSGAVRILIATDVASRGLDINDVTHVLNYDFPRNIEEYVHRVGRTGRAGKSGESISYVTKKDWSGAAELIKILEEADQYIPEEIYGMAKRFAAMQERKEQEGGGRGRGGRGRTYGSGRYGQY